MDKYETLSYCGIDCNRCSNFKQNMNCAGCRNEKDMLSDCPTRFCAMGKKLLHCGECEDFPCGELNDFYNDGKPSHYQAYLNTLEINKIGVDEWLIRQESK
jgi:hypothetical protein